ncbi:MAG: glycosyltransferase family 39 protein, partial [Anaerolineales bacterium]|nr:glycosyltransferase family 39 protein [Anaerolineales bacterium]
MNVDNETARVVPARKLNWVYDLLLIFIVLIGAYFRFTGMDWDEDQHLHPDERFLSSVESAIEPVENLSAYFDTANSSLNPNNRGHNYFVYGTFPIFLTRYVGEWTGQVGYGPITLVGRYLSALADLLVVIVVYLAATRLYDRRVGILAAAFSAFTVLQIQVSHFFAVDTFLNLFIFLSIYFAILIATDTRRKPVNAAPAVPEGGAEGEVMLSADDVEEMPAEPVVVETRPAFNVWHFVLFGVAFGLAMASKLSAYPVAAILPLAVALRMSKWKREEISKQLLNAFVYLVVGAVVSILVFRIFQPYAFKGPGFFGFGLNENWVSSIQSQRAQAKGEQDWPPSIQWARRTHLYSFENLFTWGLGIPMGIAAWGGLLWVAIRMLQR